MIDLDEVVARVHAGRRFLSTAHASPDGDALGSMLATAFGLRALGKEVVLYDRDPPPARLAWLPGADEIKTTPPPSDARFDLTFVHDCGDARLLGAGFPPPSVTGPLVVLDHHAVGRPFGELSLRDPSAAAVGVLVARLLARLGVTLDRPMAEALWCSLVSDTGWFRYPATDVETLRLGTECVAAGVRPWEFALRVEEAWPPARARLLALVLGTLELVGEPPRRAALLTLTEEMLHQAGAKPEYAEGFVNYARGLEGVEVGVLLTEMRRGVRVSLRSKGAVDVGAIAGRFDGGGHRGAAGCTLALPLADARRQLTTALLEVLSA
jgi:phosphoesterase RecJ-like protein